MLLKGLHRLTGDGGFCRFVRSNSRVVLSIHEPYWRYLGFVWWPDGVSCTSCGTFLNKKYSSCSRNSCDAFYALVVCAPRAWSPRVIRVDTLSHGQRDSKSLLWDLRIDQKTWLLQVERYFTCKAVLNYYYSVPMSLVYHHFFLFLTEREIYLKGTWWWN